MTIDREIHRGKDPITTHAESPSSAGGIERKGHRKTPHCTPMGLWVQGAARVKGKSETVLL